MIATAYGGKRAAELPLGAPAGTVQTTQLENYLDIAREQGFDTFITISNQIPPAAGQHPSTLDKHMRKRVALHHYSWSQVLAEAVMQKERRGVADPDQAWILSELIRYLAPQERRAEVRRHGRLLTTPRQQPSSPG